MLDGFKFNPVVTTLTVGSGGIKLNGNALYTNSALTRKIQDNGSLIEVTGQLYCGSDITSIGYFKANSGVIANSNATLNLIGRPLDGASAVMMALDSTITYSTAGAKLLSIRNNTVEKAYVDKDGVIVTSGAGFGLGGAPAAQGIYKSGSESWVVAASGNIVRLTDAAGAHQLNASGSQVDVRTGTGTGRSIVGGILSVNTTAVGNVGTGEDDLMTYPLPANSLVTTGRGIEITAWGTTANNANAKAVKLYFGSTIIQNYSLTTSVAGKWKIAALVFRTGTSAQDYVSELREKDSQWHDIESGTLTETETSAITIKCTGEAVADNDVVQEGMIVKYV